MIKTIKELLIEWWAGNSTTKMPLPTIYTYEVNVDGRRVHIKSMSRSRMHIIKYGGNTLMPITSEW